MPVAEFIDLAKKCILTTWSDQFAFHSGQEEFKYSAKDDLHSVSRMCVIACILNDEG